ncbi:MAG: hypothetical protein AB7P22_17605 [Vicinamibacterales bacterium]
MTRSPRDLESDLASLGNLFHPRLRESSVRKFINDLGPAPVYDQRMLRSPLVLQPDALVAPEGRIALEVLRELDVSGPNGALVIPQDVIAGCLVTACDTYRAWSLYRVEGVLELRRGKAPSLHPASIALILWLLVNRSISSDSAIDLESLTTDSRERIRRSVANCLDAFVRALPSRRSRSHGAIRFDDWPLSEARRRLGEALTTGRVFIREDQQESVVRTVASELRHRETPVSEAEGLQAFDALVAAYKAELPVLATLGMAHEAGSQTRKLRKRLGELLVEHDRPA